eukprot:m.947751 g.947751  ORF g.947751 m.947751 type:complete len:74 (-) comp23848_c0_seq80:567-788(-)
MARQKSERESGWVPADAEAYVRNAVPTAFPIDMQPPPAYAETAVSQQPVPMSPLNPNMSRHRLSNIFTPERGW